MHGGKKSAELHTAGTVAKPGSLARDADVAGVGMQEQHAEGVKPGVVPGRKAEETVPVGRVRSMQQLTEDGRMSTRPLAHVQGLVASGGKGLRSHRLRFIRKRQHA